MRPVRALPRQRDAQRDATQRLASCSRRAPAAGHQGRASPRNRAAHGWVCGGRLPGGRAGRVQGAGCGARGGRGSASLGVTCCAEENHTWASVHTWRRPRPPGPGWAVGEAAGKARTDLADGGGQTRVPARAPAAPASPAAPAFH